ncbi:MAG: hypothetical protein ACYC6Q_06365 [Syntrophales bacterium]
MIKNIFRSSLRKKLVFLLQASQRDHFSCGKQVHCRVGIRPEKKYAITAYIITNNVSLGDVNGVYHFYESRYFDDFRSALIALSEEVTEASNAVPGFTFFRSFEFVSSDKVKEYIYRSENIHDREKWLFNSLNWDFGTDGVWLEEQFENGSWTYKVTQKEEMLHLLSDTIINSPYT